MSNTKTGYIYKICCKNPDIKDIYVGSTMCIKQRKYLHKSTCNNEKSKAYNTYVYRFIRENHGWDNFDMIVLQKIEYEDKYQLRQKERQYIERLGASLNKTIPTRNQKEYYQLDEVKEKRKQYYEDNKEIIKKRQKKYRMKQKQLSYLISKLDENEEDRKSIEMQIIKLVNDK
jgi:hypothetical protein